MITIYPAFYSIDRHPTIHQVLAEYFDEDQGFYTLTNEGTINILSVYLVDFCDMPSIHALTKNITITFSLSSLTFCFEKPCEIVSFFIDHDLT